MLIRGVASGHRHVNLAFIGTLTDNKKEQRAKMERKEGWKTLNIPVSKNDQPYKGQRTGEPRHLEIYVVASEASSEKAQVE